MDYKTLISERISEVLKMDKESVINLIEVPSKEEMGDFAFPCFKLAKILRKAPNNIALNILDKINKDGFDKVEVIGAYLNFFVDKKSLTENTLNEILEKGDKYGSSDVGKGKNITIDYSSPNIAKPFHIGHLSTTVIGNSLYRLFKFAGYNSIGINHLGDWGTQFGKLIAAYNRWIDEDALENDPIKELLRIYVKFHAEAEKEPSLNDEARLHFKRLEEGAKEETALWKRFKDLSLREFNKVYDKLNIHFDHFTGESFYSDKMGAVVDELEKKGLLTESRGAEVVMLDKYNMPPCIIKKSDGATIYATRDLAAAIYRKKTYDFYKNIYVVGTPQALHFKQVFTTLKLMGYKWADDCKHVGFGLVKFKDKKLATRTGDVIFLDDLLNEAVSNILEIINKKNPELKDKEKVAEKVGVGAVIFAYLKNSREKDIVFSWNEMLSFEGETGPYVQYTYARGKSILRKAEGIDLSSVDLSKLTLQEETDIVKLLSVFNHAVMNAIERYEPSIVTRYVIDVAEAFNKFYNQVNILNCDDEEAKKARLVLTKATCQVIKNALSLLGIDVVERM